MASRVDLGSNETPSFLSHLINLSCVFVHLLHQVTLRSTRPEHGSVRVKDPSDGSSLPRDRQLKHRRPSIIIMGASRRGFPLEQKCEEEPWRSSQHEGSRHRCDTEAAKVGIDSGKAVRLHPMRTIAEAGSEGQPPCKILSSRAKNSWPQLVVVSK